VFQDEQREHQLKTAPPLGHVIRAELRVLEECQPAVLADDQLAVGTGSPWQPVFLIDPAAVDLGGIPPRRLVVDVGLRPLTAQWPRRVGKRLSNTPLALLNNSSISLRPDQPVPEIAAHALTAQNA
jgi:hypothetical protein